MAAAAATARSGPLIQDQNVTLGLSSGDASIAVTPERSSKRGDARRGTYPRLPAFRLPQRRNDQPELALDRHEVAEAPRIALHHVPALEGDLPLEDRPAEDKGMKLSVLPAGVDDRRKIREQRVVEGPSGE